MAIARALLSAPGIILADEPTGNLDRENGAQVVMLMRELCSELGTLFLISTHDEAIAAESDRVVRILDGRVVRDERVAATQAHPGYMVWMALALCRRLGLECRG